VRNDREFDLSQIQVHLSDRKNNSSGPEVAMTGFILSALITSCVIGTAMAQSCERQATSRRGQSKLCTGLSRAGKTVCCNF